MIHALEHAFEHTLTDVLQAIPILLIVYALLYWIENRLRSTPALLEKSAEFGPVVGALAGLVPQCGFSAAASALFSDGYLAPATLVAVFLSTSDEALPVLLSDGVPGTQIVVLFVSKFVLAVVGGYALKLIWGKHRNQNYEIEVDMGSGCGCGCDSGPVRGILGRTVETVLMLFIITLLLEFAIHGIGTDRLSTLMLKDSIFQPVICAIVGLIPSCAVSVLLTQLYTSGVLSMGSLIAGLSTGAGFGYMILLGNENGRKKALPIILATLVLAIVGGLIVHVFFPF